MERRLTDRNEAEEDRDGWEAWLDEGAPVG